MERGLEYLIKYQTFDQLLDSVRDDFETYESEGMIDSSRLIKVVKECNKHLGLKLHKDKETILKVKNYSVQLPDDFYSLNFGLLCYNETRIVPKVSGTHTEDFWVQLGCNVDTCQTGTVITVPDTPCERAKLCINGRGQYFTILQRFRNEVMEYSHFDLVQLKSTRRVEVSNGCFNISSGSQNEITIQDGRIYTNFCEGQLYISYIGDLVDEDGNLLVLFHPLVNDYYEYAIKRRLLENYYLDGDESVARKLQFLDERFRVAKRQANRLVDTPEFTELNDMWLRHRKDWYDRYFYPITGQPC